MSDTKIRFTEQVLEKLAPTNKRTRYLDSLLPGLVLEITQAGKKSFRIYKKIPGRSNPISVTLGSFPSISLEAARKLARKAMSDIAEGINPNDTKRQFRAAAITLKEAFDVFITTRKRKPVTIRGYTQVIACYLEDWRSKRLADITESMILKRHRDLTSQSPAQADLTMRVLRALFNFAKAEYKTSEGRSLFIDNPVGVLSEKRAWNNVTRKNTRLRQSQLKPFMKALTQLRDDAIKYRKDSQIAFCDYIEFIAFTGLRKMELLELPWDQVFIEDRIFLLKDTKNGSDIELPMTDRLAVIFERRKHYKVSSYVFGTTSAKGYLTEPKKTVAKICEAADVKFTLHDLRRTYTSIAESVNVGGYTLKRLLNHSTSKSDVTAGYTILTAEELREPADKVNNKLEECAGLIMKTQNSEMVKMKNLIASLTKEQKIELMSTLLN